MQKLPAILITVVALFGYFLLRSYLNASNFSGNISKKISNNISASRLENSLNNDPMLKGLKEQDPTNFQKLRDEVVSMTREGKSDEEIGKRLRQSAREIAQAKLKHASAEDIHRYLTLRLELLKILYDISPLVCYGNIMQEPVAKEYIPDRKQEVVEEKSKEIVRFMLALKEAPPISQDNKKAELNAQKVYATLSVDELKIIESSAKKPPSDDKKESLYCRATMHFYESCLKLPAADAVGIFRYFEELPLDDRKP